MSIQYYEASQNSELYTKPVFLYYACMWLAVAEFLFKGTGDVSLDRARGENKHHGLEFVIDSSKFTYDALEFAEKLRAKPMISSGRYKGTFELWRQTARKMPLCGDFTEVFGMGNATGVRPLFHSEDRPPIPLESTGTSLIDCWGRIPFMVRPLTDCGWISDFLRTTITAISGGVENYITTSIMVHPCDPAKEIEFTERFLFDPNDIENINFTKFPSGFSLQTKSPKVGLGLRRFDHRGAVEFPDGCNYGDQVWMYNGAIEYTEFENIYISLYILSNLSRYYPDFWIDHTTNHTLFSDLCDQFLSESAESIARLAYSELSRTYHFR